jgi:D-aminoacyl-tRNA deacylase
MQYKKLSAAGRYCMIALLQRVKSASVTVDEKTIASIEQGLLVLLGVEKNDELCTTERLAEKILKYRIFADAQDKMNLSVMGVKGSVLMVPQFTLVADTEKGLRPSFSKAASPEKGLAMFSQLIDIMRVKGESMSADLPLNWLQTGQFGADMAVELLNDGPVTFTIKI